MKWYGLNFKQHDFKVKNRRKMTEKLHKSKIEFQKIYVKSNYIRKSRIVLNQSIAKFRMKFKIKCETSNLSNMHFIN